MGLDMNVQEAWAEGVTGKGTVVTILDDGLEKDPPDIRRNYVSGLASLPWRHDVRPPSARTHLPTFFLLISFKIIIQFSFLYFFDR